MILPGGISRILSLLFLTANTLSQAQLDHLDTHEKQTENITDSSPTKTRKSHDHHFDFLMFTQLWPISNCIDWEERGSGHTCSLNDDFEWTVHGIWPTTKHKKGPLFCRKDLPFNEKSLDPILKHLEARWLNVRNGTGEYDFWKHEWLKHGTCAVQLKPMDSEIKYFNQGLKWQEEYHMQKILADAGITPGGQYKPKNIVDAVGKYLGAKANTDIIHPAITCRKEKGYQNQLIFELIICFDKELNLTHCDDVAAGLYAHCPQDDSYIVYPQTPDLGWTNTRYALILSACFFAFALLFIGALYRQRSQLGPPRNGCCWNKCYKCCGNDDGYVHPFIVDNYDAK